MLGLTSRLVTPSTALSMCLAVALAATLGGCGGSDGSETSTGTGGQAGDTQGGGAGSGSTGATGGLGQGGSAGATQGGSGGSEPVGGSGGSDLGSGGSSTLSCPPSGPFGSSVGELAPAVTLYDCDGNAVSLHDLCSAPVSVVYTFAAWCPVCRSHMESGRPNQLLAEYQPAGLQEWVVVTQKNDGSNADAQLCELTRDTYSLTPKVLFDPDDSLRKMVGVQVNSGGLVMTEGGRIELKVGYDFDAVEAKVESLLAP